MKLVWHIVKKDFRRLWLPLALWTLLLIAKGEVGVRALASDGGEERVFYFSLCENTLVVLEAIVNLLLVAALVQEDLVVGTGMFWATRPIGGGRLLAAKLLGAGLMFGVLPMAAAVRWWLVCGYGLPEMARGALGIADTQAVTVGVALLLAVVTKNINEFLGWVMGLAVVVVLWFLWLTPKWAWLRPEVSWGVSETRDVLVFVLTGIGAATVIAHQFLTRRLARTGLLVAGVAAGVAAVYQSRWNFSGLWLRAPYSAALADGVSVAVQQIILDQKPSVEFNFHGVPERYGVMAGAAQTWRWADGTWGWAQKDSFTGSWPGWAEWRALGLPGGRHEAATQVYTAAGPRGAQDVDRISAVLPMYLSAEKVTRLQTEVASYVAKLDVALLRPELEFETPSRLREERWTRGFGVRVGPGQWVDGEWRARVMESRPTFARYGRWRSPLATLLNVQNTRSASFALVNRGRGEGLKLWRSGGESMQVGGQELRWDRFQIKIPRDADEQNAEAQPRWLEGATVAVMRYREEAKFDHEIKVERFPILTTAQPTKDKSP